MKIIGLQQWAVDLLCEDDVLEDKKKITSNDDLQYVNKKLTDNTLNDESVYMEVIN